MDIFTEASLRNLFVQVERQTVIYFDWHSKRGEAFLEAVDRAVENGVDINEIGSVIGIRNFSQRYSMLRRHKGGQGNSRGEGLVDSTLGLQGGLPQVRTGTEGEGRPGPGGRDQVVPRLQEES